MENSFVIYGAGNKGKWMYEFLKWRGLEERIECFVDRNYEEIKQCCGRNVISLCEALKKNRKYLVAIEDEQIAKTVKRDIEENNVEVFLMDECYKLLEEEQHVFYREWCAFHHATQNDKWFEDAEDEKAVAVFWGEESTFLDKFKSLNLDNVIEIACGHGRHVPHYVDKAGKVTLVDILEENMVICKERFKDKDNIVYYKNNGFNLEKLDSDAYTSVFSYDSMVHFELFDVYEYLKDIYRVLKKGGKALLHHSNYEEDYKADFTTASHARCFMGKNVFAYMAHRVGFRIVEQEVIDWYGEKSLDCITVLEKK
ncbi:MAG: class I SAM-dependent methyltransferase [Lachnospiraceae bacterium]|nr:class I SAM-dependent methyltransferase [Lachnospiraceae bacterium]